MKKSILFFLAICFLTGTNVNAQLSLKKVTNSVTNQVLGKPEASPDKQSNQPEPKCACDQPELILDLSGKLKVDYTEINISMMADGSILVKDRLSGKYYVAKDGVTKGPFSEGDQEVTAYTNTPEADNDKSPLVKKYKDYISQTGDKYLITFNGKKYGPYGEISEFVVTKSKEKFAAVVTENVPVSEADAKKMEDMIKNAKTDQERMELSMQYSQQMMQKIQQGGGPNSMTPKTVTNIPNSNYDLMKAAGGNLNANIKFDDILIVSYDKIIDLKMNTVLTLKQEAIGAKDLFVNSSNTKYAYYNYGGLTFSDGTTMSDMFNLHWVKVDGQVYLAYMYYSPKRNAIMQCKMLF